jgi:integrase/recombinase XerD
MIRVPRHPVLQSAEQVMLTVASLHGAAEGWYQYGEIEGWSHRTKDDRRSWMGRLEAFLTARELDFCAEGLRAFVVALMQGNDGGGRKPLSPSSVLHAHIILSAFANWCVAEGILTDSPMRRIPTPKQVDPGIDPFTDAELEAILNAASESRCKLRDVALIRFLDDTGIRASELADLRVSDLRMTERTAQVRNGKGGKPRTISFGAGTAQALWRYLRDEQRKPAEPLFTSSRTGGPMNRSSLLQVCRRLGKEAKVENVHPHRFRHDAAVRLLRNGAHVFGVMSLLGHTRVATTQIYVKLAEADISKLHANASPIDNLLTTRRAR